MIRTAIYTLLGVLASIPVYAHEEHEEAMHHWEDVRYIHEIHVQFVVLLVAALLLGAFLVMKRRRNLV